MKISIFFDHLLDAQKQTGKTIPELLQIASECGISALEINLQQLLNQIDENPDFPELIKSVGLGISCIYEFYDWTNGKDFEKAKLHVDTAQMYGARRILIVPGFLTEEESKLFEDCSDYDVTAEKMESLEGILQIKEMLQKTCDYAASTNVIVTLEDFDGYTSPCSHTNQLLWWFKNVKGLMHTFDMGNYAYSKEDCSKAFDILKEYIVHAHCKDRGENLACVPVGGGLLPIGTLVQNIMKLDYDGYFAIEHFGSPDQLNFIKQSAQFLNKLN